MIRVIEIHAAEGGDDAKLLAADLAHAYERFFDRKS
jgi:protein subunit release factor A